jgi:hypothetical protein
VTNKKVPVQRFLCIYSLFNEQQQYNSVNPHYGEGSRTRNFRLAFPPPPVIFMLTLPSTAAIAAEDSVDPAPSGTGRGRVASAGAAAATTGAGLAATTSSSFLSVLTTEAIPPPAVTSSLGTVAVPAAAGADVFRFLKLTTAPCATDSIYSIKS